MKNWTYQGAKRWWRRFAGRVRLLDADIWSLNLPLSLAAFHRGRPSRSVIYGVSDLLFLAGHHFLVVLFAACTKCRPCPPVPFLLCHNWERALLMVRNLLISLLIADILREAYWKPECRFILFQYTNVYLCAKFEDLKPTINEKQRSQINIQQGKCDFLWTKCFINVNQSLWSSDCAAENSKPWVMLWYQRGDQPSKIWKNLDLSSY